MKYDVEKILYFAAQPSGFHVAPDEKTRNTTVHRLTRELIKAGELTRAAEDDSGFYLVTTDKGNIHLLELRIAWRTKRCKDVADLKEKLSHLLGEEKPCVTSIVPRKQIKRPLDWPAK